MKELLLGLLQRFKEPSSWAAITAALVGAVPMLDGSGQALAYVGAGIAGLAAFFLKEKGDASES